MDFDDFTVCDSSPYISAAPSDTEYLVILRTTPLKLAITNDYPHLKDEETISAILSCYLNFKQIMPSHG